MTPTIGLESTSNNNKRLPQVPHGHLESQPRPTQYFANMQDIFQTSTLE